MLCFVDAMIHIIMGAESLPPPRRSSFEFYETQCPSLHQTCHKKSRAGDMNTVSILTLSMFAADSARFDLHGQRPVPCSSDVINGRRGTDGAL